MGQPPPQEPQPERASPPSASAGGATASGGGGGTPRSGSTVGRRLLTGALVVAPLVALLLSYLAWWAPRSPEPRAAELRVVGLDVSRLEEVPYVPTEEMGGPEAATIDVRFQDSVVDVQVENSGGSPVLVTEIEADILYTELLVGCPGIGGELLAAGNYDIKVSTVDNSPKRLSAEKPIQVDADSFERFTISVGPIGTHPWIYTVDLAALTSDGERLPLGRVTLVNPTSSLGGVRAQPYSQDPEMEPCVRDNQRTLTEALAMDSVAGPEVQELKRRFDRGVAALDGEAASYPQGQRPEEWADVVLAACTDTGRDTALLAEDHGDVTGDGAPEVILTQRCVGPASLTPHVVRVFDGRSAPAAPEQLGPTIGAGDGLDSRGLQVTVTRVVNERLIVYSELHRPSDPDARPSVFATDIYAWTGTTLDRAEARECLDTTSTVIDCGA